MALNTKVKILLFLIRMQKELDMTTETPESFRAFNRKALAKLRWLVHYRAENLFQVKDEFISVSNGEQIKVRIYKPTQGSNLPLIIYFHGGGCVIGSIETHDLTCRRLAKQNNCIVVSVDYRLAPEYPFPIPAEDCYAATVWAVENARDLGANPKQVVVMGDSAGGNLATVVAMMARDKGGPDIACQILIYPITHMTLSTASVHSLGKGYLLTKAMIEWFNKHYCGNENDLNQSYLSPLFANNLKGLPPALIVTAEYDPLKDEGEAYAKKLKEAGNQVTFKEYKGMIHTFFTMPKYLKEARMLEAQVSSMLIQYLSPRSIPSPKPVT